jgi:hypothetical protein
MPLSLVLVGGASMDFVDENKGTNYFAIAMIFLYNEVIYVVVLLVDANWSPLQCCVKIFQ